MRPPTATAIDTDAVGHPREISGRDKDNNVVLYEAFPTHEKAVEFYHALSDDVWDKTLTISIFGIILIWQHGTSSREVLGETVKHIRGIKRYNPC